MAVIAQFQPKDPAPLSQAADGSYVSDNQEIKASFSNSATSNVVDVEARGYKIRINPGSLKYLDLANGFEDVLYDANTSSNVVVTRDYHAVYDQHFPTVDERFEVEAGKLKHYLTINSEQRPPVDFLENPLLAVTNIIEFDASLRIRQQGMVMDGDFQTDTDLELIDPNDNVVFTIPAIETWDQKQETTGGLFVVSSLNPGQLEISMTVDNAWISDTARVYPIVVDPTVVVSSAYSTGGNGGRRLVQLSNNWLVTAVINTTSNTLIFYVSMDNGTTWQTLTTSSTTAQDVAIAAIGTNVYAVFHGTNGSVYCEGFDATTIGASISYGGTIDTGLSANTVNNISLVVDRAGTLHVAYVAMASPYTTSNNIKYSKSTNAGATWDSPTWISNYGSVGYNAQYPNIVVRSNGYPTIAYSANTSSNTYAILAATWNGTSWLSMTNGNGQTIMPYDTYSKTNPCAAVDSNDVIHVVWHGVDTSYPSYSNVRYSKSTDGGNTWAAQTLLSTNSSYSQAFPTIAVDQNNNVYVFWSGIDSNTSTSYTQIKRGICSNGTWSFVVLTSNTTGNASNPQSLWSKFNMNSSDAIRYMYMDNQANAVKYDSYTLNSAPNAPTNLVPTGGTTVTSLTPTLSGTFSDPDNGNTMSALQVQVYRASDNVLMWDSTKTPMTTTTSNQNWSISVPTSANLVYGVQYYWKAVTWDNSSAQGAWSGNQAFLTEQAPTVTITAPTATQVITTSSIVVQLSYSQAANIAEASYQFQLLDANSNVLQDSGVINGANNQYTFNGLANNTQYQIIAYATTKDGAKGTSTKVSFSTSFTPPQVPTVTTTNDAANARVRVDFTNPAIVTNLVQNSDFETVTGTGTMFSDALNQTIAPAWTVRNGSFTFGTGGATSNAASSIMTAGNSAWKPLTGSNGAALPLTMQATYTMPATVPSGLAFLVELYQDANNDYQIQSNGTSMWISKKVAGAFTTLSSIVSQALTASATYTITLSITPSGALTAKLYSGNGTGGTLLQTLTATDTSLAGGFLIGVGGDTGVVISNAYVSAPRPDAWSIYGDTRVAWALTTNAINGRYSISAVGVANGATGFIVSNNPTATASTQYTASAYMNGSNIGSGGAYIAFNWTNSGTNISGTGVNGPALTGTFATQRTTLTATSPSTANGTKVLLMINDVGTVFFDEVQIEQSATANAYVRNDSTVSSASNYPTAASNTIYRRKVGDIAWTQLATGATTPYFDFTCPVGNYEYGVTAASSAGSASDYGKSQVACAYQGDWLYEPISGSQFQFLYNRKDYTLETMQQRKEYQTNGSKVMVRYGALNAKKGTLAAMMPNVTQTPMQQILAIEAIVANHPTFYLKMPTGEVLKVDAYAPKRSMPREALFPYAIEFSLDWSEVA